MAPPVGVEQRGYDPPASERVLPPFPPPVTQPAPFLFSSLSSVWRGLKTEFWKGLKDDPAPEGDDATQVGSKRTRTMSVSESGAAPSSTSRSQASASQKDQERTGKRRKKNTSTFKDDGTSRSLWSMSRDRGWCCFMLRVGHDALITRRGTPTAPVPSTSQANALAQAYEAVSPARFADSRPGRSSLKAAGAHSLTGKRKLGAMPPLGSLPHSATNPNLAATAISHVHFTLPPSRSIPDLRTLGISGGVQTYTFPPSSTVASADKMPASPSAKKGKGSEQVDTMLIGDLGFDVNRAWKDAKEEERVRKDQRRIAELEKEVKRLKDVVCFPSSFFTG